MLAAFHEFFGFLISGGNRVLIDARIELQLMKQSLILTVFLSTACLYAAQEPRTQFLPGQIWPDNHGIHINAHGGGVLFHSGIYYWFGEHKIQGDAGNDA